MGRDNLSPFQETSSIAPCKIFHKFSHLVSQIAPLNRFIVEPIRKDGAFYAKPMDEKTSPPGPLRGTSLTCCACAAQAEEEKGETAAKTAGTEAYSLTLPATITAKEQENNTLTLFLDGTEVGGVAVIAYENAAALDLDSLGDGHAEKELNQILQLVAPEGHVDHMFESYGEDGYLSLSLVPWPDRDEPETIHYLFPKGDAFYDLFFQADAIPDTEEQLLLDSFTLTA